MSCRDLAYAPPLQVYQTFIYSRNMRLSAARGLDLSRILTPLTIYVQHNPLKVVLRLTSGCTNTCTRE